MTKFERHPLSALFAMYDLAGDDLKALAEDIKKNGQIQPITLHEGMVLDGWNRYQGCIMAKVKPKSAQLKAGVEPWAFVCSSNMHRRHMTAAERVGVMALYLQMQGGEDRSKLTAPSVKQIEKTLDVSHGTAVKAAQVAKAADPDVAEALAKKEISLDRAAEISKLPEAERREAVKAPQAPKPAPTKAPDDRDVRIAQLTRLLSEAQAELADLKGRFEEQGQHLREAIADNESMERTINADNSLSGMMAENKRFREENRVLTSRNHGLMNANADLTKAASSWKGKFEKLQRKILEAEGQGAGSEIEDMPSTEDEEYNAAFGEAS